LQPAFFWFGMPPRTSFTTLNRDDDGNARGFDEVVLHNAYPSDRDIDGVKPQTFKVKGDDQPQIQGSLRLCSLNWTENADQTGETKPQSTALQEAFSKNPKEQKSEASLNLRFVPSSFKSAGVVSRPLNARK
jgi:hypothetical protein